MQSFPYLAEHSIVAEHAIVSVFGRTFNRYIVVERLEASKRQGHFYQRGSFCLHHNGFSRILFENPVFDTTSLFETVQGTNQTFSFFITQHGMGLSLKCFTILNVSWLA